MMVKSVRSPSPGEPDFSGQARDRILSAASIAFSARGFHGVTVRDLALQANVNLGAINYYFRSKEDLYRAVIERALDLWFSEIVALDDLNPSAALPEVIGTIVSALVAPVIERQEAPILARLIAWDLLQGQSSTQSGASPAVTAAIRNRLTRHLPGTLGSDALTLIADWLVSQCLLLTPALRAPHAEASLGYEASRHLAEQVSHLALNGLSGIVKRGA